MRQTGTRTADRSDVCGGTSQFAPNRSILLRRGLLLKQPAIGSDAVLRTYIGTDGEGNADDEDI
jgi:hypothetical protein